MLRERGDHQRGRTMKLTPIETKDTPRYPARSARWHRAWTWARRLGTAASASALLTFSACSDATTIDTPTEDAGLVDSGDDAGDDGGFDAGASDGGTSGDAAPPEDGDVTGDGDVVEDGDVTGDADIDGDPDLPPLSWCEVDYRLSGDMAPVEYFACAAALPPDAPIHEVPVFIGAGHVCGDETAWMRLNITEAMRIRIGLPYSRVNMEVIDPEGTSIATVGAEHGCVELEVSPGMWVLAATPGPEGSPNDYFEFYVDRLDE
jgi:hypothetical protein